jgi:hypothetical protein
MNVSHLATNPSRPQWFLHTDYSTTATATAHAHARRNLLTLSLRPIPLPQSPDIRRVPPAQAVLPFKVLVIRSYHRVLTRSKQCPFSVLRTADFPYEATFFFYADFGLGSLRLIQIGQGTSLCTNYVSGN